MIRCRMARVPIDRSLAPLLPRVLARCERDLLAARAALDARDFGTVGRLGHGLAGAGGTYGLDALSDLGRALERAARARDGALIGEALAAARRFLDDLDPEPV
jgi:HPt (histidine-containing phosphotransfer) domain-containing protein